MKYTFLLSHILNGFLILSVIAIAGFFASCKSIPPAVQQKLLLDGTGILITGGEALLLSGGNGGAAATAMSAQAVANIPGLKAVIADSVAKSAKNPVTPAVITITPVPAASPVAP